MMKVTYTEYRELACRGAVDPEPSVAVEGILLVGTEPALEFYDNQSSYGEDSVSLYPAVLNGERSWLKRSEWQASHGYSATGTNECVIPFEAGVKLFLERGVFEFPVPDSEPALKN
jgi:hypothetical protein